MTEKDAQTFVDIGGRRLAMRGAGEGFPTVVLEMGLGSAGSFYDDIARQIASFTRVVWYDHAGLGQSDPAPTPRTIQDLALDLHTLLQHAAIPGPYVLAGHSMGGLTVRFYQQQYSAEVAAIVLIDSAHEDQRERYLAALPLQREDELSGLARLRDFLLKGWEDPTANGEYIDNLANSALMRSCGPFDALPLTVISRGHSNSNPAEFPPGVIERIEQGWHKLQCELTALSSQSKHIIAENSGHLINKDEPELLIESIWEVVMQVRRAQSSS